jgi:hypothetical protein
MLWYSDKKEALLCEKCAQNPDSLLRIGPGGRQWLLGIESLPPAASEALPVDATSLEQAKALSQVILAEALGRRLPTWEGI